MSLSLLHVVTSDAATKTLPKQRSHCCTQLQGLDIAKHFAMSGSLLHALMSEGLLLTLLTEKTPLLYSTVDISLRQGIVMSGYDCKRSCLTAAARPPPRKQGMRYLHATTTTDNMDYDIVRCGFAPEVQLTAKDVH